MTAEGPIMAVGDENSLEPILFSEFYPKKPTQCDEDGLKTPFIPLHGESVEYLGRTSDGTIALSNYRVFVMLKESYINIPVGVIETVEYRDIFFMHVFCKDARTFRCAFATNDVCLEWCKRLNRVIRPLGRLIDAFAFSFHAWMMDSQRQNRHGDDEPKSSVFDREVQRLGYDLKSSWRITHANSDFKVCNSYPKQHIVPYAVSDKDIENVAEFRSSRRFPSIVWRDTRSGVVLARSSQPTVGWLGWRNTQDEAMLKAIADSCGLIPDFSNGDLNCIESSIITDGYGLPNGNGASASANGVVHTNGKLVGESSSKLVIIDARSYAAAVANRAKGGGCECQEYYTNCEIMFMSLANIHTIRKSFLALRALCAMSPDQPGWLINLENTKWLQYISGLLKSAVIVVNTIDKECKPVLVHCSDGWDRTPQIVALAELMLDPFYRTMEGFRVLVEKEWIEFGHKFSDRCGQGVAIDDVNERCPVFLQWLDCVHQLVRQFPCAFQFNETYLVKLVQHVYSCLFGDFLCNTELERTKERVRQKTASVWLLLSQNNMKFVNLLYRESVERVLRPSCHIQNLHFWNAVYLSDTATAAQSDVKVAPLPSVAAGELAYAAGSEASSSSGVTSPDQQLALPAKTRSCDDLTKAGFDEDDDDVHPITSAQRRLSDSNLANHIAASAANEDKMLSVINCEPDGSAIANDEVKVDENSSEKTGGDELLHCHDTRKYASSETLKALDVDYDVPALDGATCHAETVDCGKNYNPPELLNGSVGCRDEEDCQNRALKATDREVFETSSDTLTGDDGHIIATETERSGNEFGCCRASLVSVSTSSIHTAVQQSSHSASLDALSCHCSNSLGNLKTTDRCSSTSDISSSQVIISNDLSAIEMKWHNQATGPLSVDTAALQVSLGRNGFTVGTDTDGSLSQTPSRSSTSPPTPSGDLKSGVWPVRPTESGYSLDWDGLTCYVDPIQQRIAQINARHEQYVHQLKRQLAAAQMLLKRYDSQAGQLSLDGKDEQASNDSGERGSTGAVSAAASDVSWEQIEEKDSKVTLWVPDHAVTHCTGCQHVFWIARRKHHCRNCGNVFCAECSDYMLPVPQQQLDQPSRVCSECYKQVLSASNGDLTAHISATHVKNVSGLPV